MAHSANAGFGVPVRLTRNWVGVIIASLVGFWWVSSFVVLYVWVESKPAGSYAPNWLPLLMMDTLIGVLGLAGYVVLGAGLPE